MLTQLDKPYIKQIGKYKRTYIKVQCQCQNIFELRYDSLSVTNCCLKCKKKKPFDKNLSSRLELGRELIIEDYKNGSSLEEIGEKFQATRHTIRNRLKKWGQIISSEPRFFGKSHSAWKGYGDISLTFYNQIKTGAEVRGMKMELSIEFLWSLFIKQNQKCALTGWDISFAKCRGLGDIVTASLDRIDATKGYTEDNVQWVHKMINIMKNDLSQEQFIQICNDVSKVHKEPQIRPDFTSFNKIRGGNKSASE